tara:strand:- start:2079 stop:2570 length:492 start_codon:yes stop_codon:yes gene_type:complete
MNWSELGKKVANYAPLLGSALGPVGAGVGALIASEFGTENTPEAINSFISGNPEAQVKLREIELTHKVKLQQIKLDTLQAELGDKANARQAHNQSKMPACLSVGLTLLIAVLVFLLFYVNVPDGSREVLFMLLGVVIKEWGSAMQYWFGTTRSSADKTRLLGK